MKPKNLISTLQGDRALNMLDRNIGKEFKTLKSHEIRVLDAFCKDMISLMGSSSAMRFLRYTYDSVEDHVIDTEDLKKHLLAQFENDWRVTSLQYSHIDSSHFRAVLPDLFLELERAATKQNQAAKTISETRPTLFEAYVPFCGSKVGVMILDNSDGSGALLPDQQQFIKAFENKLSSLLSQKQNEAKQLEIEAVRQREVDYKNALQEIEVFLSSDDNLVGMSKKGVRQEYADTLRIRWGEKIGQNITQKDVRTIVERVYLRRMTNQNA